MHLIGAKGITLFVAIIAIASMVGFGSGILVGRQFPAHHFEKMENSHYLYDTSTGHVCDFWPTKAEPSGVSEQPSDFMKSLGVGGVASIPPCNQ